MHIQANLTLFFGIGIGAAIMWFLQLFVEAARTPDSIESYKETPLPPRLSTLADWGRIRAFQFAGLLPADRGLPRRSPGASLILNPDRPVVHVNVIQPTADIWEPFRRWWRERVRRFEESVDPFATIDFPKWWAETFYERPPGRHRCEDAPVTDIVAVLMEDTEWMRTVPKIDFTQSRNRRVRTEAEWARIMATNLRTKEVRDAHRARGAGLRGKELAGV